MEYTVLCENLKNNKLFHIQIKNLYFLNNFKNKCKHSNKIQYISAIKNEI